MIPTTSGKQPQPVLAPQIAGLVTSVIAVLGLIGLPISQEATEQILYIVGALYGVYVVVTAWWASRKVTPLSSPRTGGGTPLVPITDPAAGNTPWPTSHP